MTRVKTWTWPNKTEGKESGINNTALASREGGLHFVFFKDSVSICLSNPYKKSVCAQKWKTTLEMIKPKNNSRPRYPPHNISPLRKNKTGVVCSMCLLPTHIFANKEWECIMSQTCIQLVYLLLLALSGDAATSHSFSPERNTLATQVCCES